jgi:hypothetical protein
MMDTSLIQLSRKLRDPGLGETVLPDGSGVLLDIDGNQVLSLSKTGLFLVHELKGGTTRVDELCERLTEAYRVDPDTARKDTVAFLSKLGEALLSG